MTRNQRQKFQEDLYYEKYRGPSIDEYDSLEAETLTNDAHENCERDIREYLKDHSKNINSDELKEYLLKKGHSNNIIWWQLKKLNEKGLK